MIDIPIAVRNALKDGSYKKNFRFEVYHLQDDPEYDKVADFTNGTPVTITTSGMYRIYYNNYPTTFKYTVNSTTTTVSSMLEDAAGGYYAAVGNLASGDVITVTDSVVTLELKIRTDDKQEVLYHDFTINNDRLVKESVKIDERMCSDDNLKFGLCEGSQLEFQAFDIDNITGKRIEAYVDVDFPVISYEYDETTNITTRTEEVESFSVPMGWFDVSESSRQASTGIRKITAYNKLKAEYLDKDATALIQEYFGLDQTIYVLDILRLLLKDYGIRIPESQVINPEYSSYRWMMTNPTKTYFNPVNYRQVAGDKGAFSPAILNSISGSSKIYLEAHAYHAIYYIYKTGYLPIQIEVDPAASYMDTAIVNYLRDALTQMDTTQGGAETWNRLHNMNSNYGDGLKDYFFYVAVRFKNGDVHYYGNHLRNAFGTFNDLAITTFTNVYSVQVVTPYFVRFGNQFKDIDDADGTVKTIQYPAAWHSVCNDVYCIGAPRDYLINNAPTYGTYTPPKMPDGSDSGFLCDLFKVKTLTGTLSPAEMRTINTSDLQNVTLRNLQTAVFETQCQFGKLDRTNNFFTGIELNNGRLYPKGDDSDPSIDALYPAEDLYPLSTSESGFKAIYSKLWADEGNIRKWKNLSIHYKGFVKDPDTHEVSETEKIYTTVVDNSGTDNYEITDNWLFKNLPWADDESEDYPEAAGLDKIEDYADAMVAKMQSVQWFPFEMWCAGLPYVEAGDEVEINIGDGAYISYVLRRTIKGIQNLQDEMINGTLDIF